MDRVIRFFIIMLTFFNATVCQAAWTWDDWGFKPNVGVDVGTQNQAFESGYGEDHFRRYYPSINFYIGTKLFKYLGIELGYEQMYRLDERKSYDPFQPTLGFDDRLGVERVYFSHAHSKGWHANLEGYLPICPRTKTYLTATAGLSWQKIHYNLLEMEVADLASEPAIWSSDRRAIARLGLGIRQMITNNFGVRLQGIWEDSSKLDSSYPVPITQGGVANPTLPSDSYTVKPKDSYIFNLGFFLEMA